ncbi:hypothetical protein Aco03nite_095910 [Actinoplanes couchii]|uniref:Phage tail collar domain-containing protein n=2 Tax=Actinoplanes couchii TaxID=403638 RepID=A0ABQ3XRQ5_9ACTN|nr:hypothetical protein Aco03nite_095910 [Actinoplanes couchii]
MTTKSQAKPLVPVGQMVVGTVTPYAARVDAAAIEERGWLYCDGRELSRSDYEDLFRVIGTLHGGGDGSTTFNLPDYRGYFLRGVDAGAGRDPGAATRTAAAPGGMGGDECGSVQGGATAAPRQSFTTSTDGQHTHDVWHIPTNSSLYAIAGSHLSIWNDGNAGTDTAGAHQHTVTDGGDQETRPENAYVAFIIRYRA